MSRFSGQVLAAQMSVAPRTMLHFSVEVGAVRPWEYVFVIGSSPALGGWMPSDAFLLLPNPDSARQRWEGAVEIGTDPELVISKWESFLNPRSVLPSVESISDVCHLHVTDKFGWSAGKNLVSEASLVGKNQNEILLRFHGNPFKFYKKRYAERSYCIKVTPFDLRHKEMFSYDLKERPVWRAWSCAVGYFEIITGVVL
uniref:CBM20 domain-containing protein n=1 Tax=Elaeophora elaphi TaxID=1147741 RepID=A0A0R3RRX9_9BILA